MNRREICLDKARQYVSKDRNSTYGDPEDNFREIAQLQAVIDRCANPVAKVALNAIAAKIARLINSPEHEDSWIDIAGYAACGYDIITKPKTVTGSIAEPETANCKCGIWKDGGKCDGACHERRK